MGNRAALLASTSTLTLRSPDMSTLINTLKNRVRYLEGENEGLARAVDNISQIYATALDRLRPHDPDFVREALGEAAEATDPAK